MSPSSDGAPDRILADHRAEMLSLTSAWQRRTGRARGAPAEQVLDSLLGALWLELAAGQTWRPALRRALYLEWERPVRGGELPLPAGLGRCDPDPVEALPPWARAWAERLADRPARDRGWTRQRRRLVRASLARLLGGPEFWLDLERRCARLLMRAASEEPPPALRREARALDRLLRQLELPPRLAEARRGLSRIAELRRAAGDPGNRAGASGCSEPGASSGSE